MLLDKTLMSIDSNVCFRAFSQDDSMRKGVSECSHLDCCNVIVMIKIFLQDGSIPGDRISYKKIVLFSQCDSFS